MAHGVGSPVGDTLQALGRGPQTARVPHRQLDERSKKSSSNTRELLVFSVSQETKDGFQGGRCKGKRFMSV